MPQTTRQFRVAAVQAEPAWLDLVGGVDRTVELIRQAAQGGARLVAFPEVWIPGYPMFLWLAPVAHQMPFVARYAAASMSTDGPEMDAIRAAAREHEITVILGFSEKAGGSLYISQLVIGPAGETVLHRRKLKPTHVERTLFGEGDGSDLAVVASPVGRLGALCCAEHLQPLSKYALYAQNEEVHVAAWPCFGLYRDIAHQMSPEASMAATQVYAIEGGCFTVTATQVISRPGVELFATTDEQRALLGVGGGFSRVYGPDGRQITQDLPETDEGLVFADVDLDLIPLAKNAFDPAGHYSRGDAVQLLHHRGRRRPVIHADDAPPPAGDGPRFDSANR